MAHLSFAVIYKWQCKQHNIPLNRLPDELVKAHGVDAINELLGQ